MGGAGNRRAASPIRTAACLLLALAAGPLAASHSPGAIQQLDAAIRSYTALALNGGWSPIAESLDLQLGQRDAQVPVIRERLRITGDYTGPGEANPYLFDMALDGAVRRFQLRHGLAANGIVSSLVRQAMNVPAETRVAQLMAARATYTRLPEFLGERYVWINLPAARLDAIENGETALSMRTVVGKPQRPTPELESTIEHLELNPYWTIPPRIARLDVLPKQARDPDYLSSRAIRVFAGWQSDAQELSPADLPWQQYLQGRNFPYRLRQDPGPQNSLGQVKIAFANPYDVYLHDTPSRVLFDLPVRAYSSGCVRLEDALALTRWLLANNAERDRARVAGQRARGRRTLFLEQPVPLYMVYLTAWTDEDGEVHFRPDIYDRIQPAMLTPEPALDRQLSSLP
jgi:murein L,D-transpeptidase YcbB/YkuD